MAEPMFTSHLSVPEFALTVSDGWTPLGIVTGCFVCPVEAESEMPETSRELAAITRRHQKAFQSALDRLRRNAAQQKAAGVVGVRLQMRAPEPDICEWTIYGTAVRSSAPYAGLPFVSTLSGQELSVLRRAGYRPVGAAYGVCVYYQRAHIAVQQQLKTGLFGGPVAEPNLERKDYTRGVYKARQNAVTRLEAAAAALAADGILGVTVAADLRPHHASRTSTSEGFVIHLTALGTAVVQTGELAPEVTHQVILRDAGGP